MKKLSLGALFVLALFNLAVNGQPQTTPAAKAAETVKAEKLPTVDEILENLVKSAGGKAAIEKVNSVIQTGTFDTGQGALPVEMAVKYPNKWRFELKFPDGNSFKQICNGTKAWRFNPQQGWQEMTPENMELTSRMLDLRAPLNFKQTYSKLVVKGKEKVGDRMAYLMEVTPKTGDPMVMAFDTEMGALVRVDFTVETEQGTFSGQNFFEDFKDFEGAKVPYTIRQEGGESWTLKIAEIKNNAPVDDKQFEKSE
jgi:outer membrane lipoprotein-sorting protein